jgi:serine/threonine protein kinase
LVEFGSNRLGSFEIVAHLDSGGMADVYLAHRLDAPGPDDLAVVKVLRDRYREEAEVVAMFRDEGRIMTRLSHPNVVSVLENGEAEDRPYIAMEYLAGDHLGVLARSARKNSEELSISLITRIGLQVANGLAYVHQATNSQGQHLGLVHRDISPQNIFMTYDGRIKILDFGIALSEDRSVATRTGILKGKLRYMSPEQIDSKPMDGRSDLFSLGIVLWELLTGTKLFKTDSEFQTMKLICEQPIPSPAEHRPDLPVTLEAIIMGMLRRPLDERYGNATELRTSLAELLREDLTGSPSDEIARTAERLLGGRKQRKQAAIDSLRASKDLQSYLFESLDEQEDVSDSGRRERPKAGAMPDDLSPEARSDPAMLATSNSDMTPEQEFRAPRKTSWLPLIIVAGVLSLAAIATTWALWSDNTPQLAPVPDPTPLVDPGPATAPAIETTAPDPTPDASVEDPPPPEDPEADGEPQDPPPTTGFLMLKTKPETEVFIDGRFIGKTPVTEMELDPGEYKLVMINKNQNIRKSVSITIRKGEVSALQYIF